jgi:hypothetical protein
VDFILKLVRRDNDGHFILLKGAIHQEEKTIFNLYVQNVSTSSYVLKKAVLNSKAQIDSNTLNNRRLQYATLSNS